MAGWRRTSRRACWPVVRIVAEHRLASPHRLAVHAPGTRDDVLDERLDVLELLRPLEVLPARQGGQGNVVIDSELVRIHGLAATEGARLEISM